MTQQLLHDLHIFTIGAQQRGIRVAECVPSHPPADSNTPRRWLNPTPQEIIWPERLLALGPKTGEYPVLGLVVTLEGAADAGQWKQ